MQSGVNVQHTAITRDNLNTFSLSSCSSLSHLKLTPSNVMAPPGIESGTPRTHQSTNTVIPGYIRDAARAALVPYVETDDVFGPIFTFSYSSIL